MFFSIFQRLAAVLPSRARGAYNLNDPQWGRGDERADGGHEPKSEQDSRRPTSASKALQT